MKKYNRTYHELTDPAQAVKITRFYHNFFISDTYTCRQIIDAYNAEIPANERQKDPFFIQRAYMQPFTTLGESRARERNEPDAEDDRNRGRAYDLYSGAYPYRLQCRVCRLKGTETQTAPNHYGGIYQRHSKGSKHPGREYDRVHNRAF